MVEMGEMSSRENFESADKVVIIALWSLQFYDNWLSTLFKHSSDVIYGEFKESESYEIIDLSVLVGKCICACLLAVCVDAYNHKYAVAFGGICSYMVTPVLALTMCITERRWMVALTLCSSSLIFVTSPAAFGVIFNQKKRPVRIQVRRLVSIMEFVQGLLLVMITELIPEAASHSEQNTQIVSWVAAVPFIVMAIVILDRLRKYVRPEVLRERGVVAVYKGFRAEITGASPKTGLSKMNVLVFMLLLLPAFSLTALGTVVANLKPDDDSQYQHPSLKRIVSASQLTVIPVVEVAVSYAPLKEMVAELLVLGLAHILNIGVLTVLCIKMTFGTQTRSLYVSNLNSTTEPLPSIRESPFEYPPSARDFSPKKYPWVIVNHSSANVTIEDPEGIMFPATETLGAFQRALSGEHNKSGTTTFTVTITPIQPQGSPLQQSITFKEDTQFLYIAITGNETGLDVVFSGEDVVLPEYIAPSKSVLIIQNIIVGRTYYGRVMGPHHQIDLKTSTGQPIALRLLPHYSKSLILLVPLSGQHRHTMWVRYVGGDVIVKRRLANVGLDVGSHPLTVIVLSIGMNEAGMAKYWVATAFLYEGKPPPPTPPPFVPDKPDAVVATTFAVFGATLGMTTVGYIHFFWMGAPVRLRCTLYAWFIVSNELLGWIASRIIGKEVGVEEAIALLLVATVTGIWHFAFGWYYERKVMPKALLRRQMSVTPDEAEINALKTSQRQPRSSSNSES